MCGIAGIMMYPKERTYNELEYIKELASELAVENQARGSHATGIATFGQDDFDVLKTNVQADKLTEYDTWLDFLDKNINNKTQNILVHTRFATQGSPTNNDNNHPIVTATNIGVHNGMIYNDDSLFMKEGLYRQAEVDSEAIFRLIDKETGNDRENTKTVAEKLSGVYAVAFVKKTERNILNYFRNSNPTTFVYIPQLNIVVFASMKNYIENAVRTANMSCKHMYHFSVNTTDIKTFEPKEDIVMQFNVEVNNPIEQLEQTPLSFKEDYSGYGYSSGYGLDSYYGDDWYTDFRDSRGDIKEEVKPKITNIYDFIDEKGLEHLMSDSDYAEMLELLDLNEKNEWSKGYKAGRESFDSEIKILKEEKSIRGLKELKEAN